MKKTYFINKIIFIKNSNTNTKGTNSHSLFTEGTAPGAFHAGPCSSSPDGKLYQTHSQGDGPEAPGTRNPPALV